jgi:LruC domain-containing protein
MTSTFRSKLYSLGRAALIFAMASGIYACDVSKESVKPSVTQPDLQFSENFNFYTTNEVKFTIAAKDGRGKAIQLPNIQIFDKDPAEGGSLLLQGGVDNTGKLTAFKAIPSYLKQVVVVSNYIGMLDKVVVPVNNNAIQYTFSPVTNNTGIRLATTANARTAAGKFTYMGSYNSQGVPDYLTLPNDVVDAGLLSAINNSLPEMQKVNRAYLDPKLSLDMPVVKDAFITITFISEGAFFKNSLGYYTYPLNNPPKSADEINKKMIAFPNISFTGSGGGLASGNKVRIPEKIAAGTGIGFFIVPTGWTGTEVSESAEILYSNPALNYGPEGKKQYNVLLNYNEKYILAFEDLRREYGSDEDFNDVVFCVTADVADAIDDTNIPPTKDTIEDKDKDGTPDKDDKYPNDPAKAYDNTTVGTLAFEDLWPYKGDFDMNDLVVNYKHVIVTNSQNKVVEMNSTFDLLAIGARYKNGFGFEMSKLNPSQIKSISSSHDKTVLEAGQAKATILVFENAFDLVPAGQDAMINTYAKLPKVACNSITITTTFNGNISMEELGAAPFNPFLIADQKRGYEVHLPGYAPTSKADALLFGTKDDGSKPANGIYYKTKEGMPFALHLPVGQFQYPVEMASITEAYLKFTPWATSNGAAYPDWYLNLEGYRDATKVYTK